MDEGESLVREPILKRPIREIIFPREKPRTAYGKAIGLLEENRPADAIVSLRGIQALTKNDYARDQVEKEIVPSIEQGDIARALRLLHGLELVDETMR
jgi:hypothetical protein